VLEKYNWDETSKKLTLLYEKVDFKKSQNK